MPWQDQERPGTFQVDVYSATLTRIIQRDIYLSIVQRPLALKATPLIATHTTALLITVESDSNLMSPAFRKPFKLDLTLQSDRSIHFSAACEP